MTQCIINSSQHCAVELLRPRKVFVQSLKVDVIIGVCPGNLSVRSFHPVIISFVLDVRDEAPLAADTIETVVCYEKLIKRIQKLCNYERFVTFSELAEQIAKLCLRDARVLKARVRVEKPEVIHEKYRIGVEVDLP